jgi:hypothetical protein
MTNPRIREVATRKEMDQVTDDFMTQGYIIKDSGVSTTLLKKKSWGSAAGWIVAIIVALVLTVFTMGISWLLPVVYGIYAHYNAPEVLLRAPV